MQDDAENRLPNFAGSTHHERASDGWWVTQVALGMEGLEPDLYKCPSDANPLEHLLVKGGGSWHLSGWPFPPSVKKKEIARLSVPITYRGICDNSECVKGVLVGRRITQYDRPDLSIMLVEGDNTKLSGVECVCFNPDLRIRNLKDGYRNRGILKQTFGRLDHTYHRNFGTSNDSFLGGHVDRVMPNQLYELVEKQQFKEGRINSR